jgi:hypothetical protein
MQGTIVIIISCNLKRAGIKSIETLIRAARLRWYGQLSSCSHSNDDNAWLVVRYYIDFLYWIINWLILIVYLISYLEIS